MRLLFVCLSLPFPPTNGQRLRNLGLLRAFKQEAHDVTLLSFADSGTSNTNRDALLKLCCEVETVPFHPVQAGSIRDYMGRLRSVVAPRPNGVRRFRATALAAKVKEWLAKKRFDAILCDDVYLIENLPRALEVPLVLNKHDLTYVIVSRYLAHVRNPLLLAYGWLEYWKLKAWETEACRRSDVVFACSKVDRDLLLARCPNAHITVVPNAIDTDEYTPADDGAGNSLLYFGSMDFFPNQDAVKYFLVDILPEIRKTVPDVKFVIAGRNAPERLRRFIRLDPGVQFLGPVEDMRPVIARASVCVVPLRVGSGTRLKILEAAAMGKPVVSTRLGAEGLDFIADEEIVLADGPRPFAEAVTGLLADRSRRTSIGKAARDRVVAEYSVAALRASIRSAFGDLLPRRGFAEKTNDVSIAGY